MTEKQKYLLKLLQEVDEICREHDLRYVLAGGSLIGALRHEGFVPWDDAIDLYMPRPDWEKFVEICKRDLPPERAIQCSQADRHYTNSYSRYASADTCAIHRSQIAGKDVAGEVIDVFTLDPIPSDDREYEKYRTYFMIYSDLLNISASYSDRWEIPVSLYRKYLYAYLFLGKDRTLSKLEKLMFSYKEEDCDRYAMGWAGCPSLFDKETFFPAKEGTFQGLKVMIPNHCSEYLTQYYGDEWSYMPAYAEREGHRTVCVEGATYKEFREDYMSGVNRGRLNRNAIRQKLYNMRIARENHRVSHKGLEYKAGCVAADLGEAIRESGLNLQELMEKGAYRKLGNLFVAYYKAQLSPDFIGREDFDHIYAYYHPVLVDIPDEVFLAAVKTLFYTERISKAFRMLEIREKADHLTGEMESLKTDILLFRKGLEHYEVGHMDECRKLCEELLEKYPGHPGLMKLKCRLLMEKTGENLQEAEQFLEKALRFFPEDGYFMKYLADILWMKGNGQKALQLYARVKENTANGFVWLEMDKLFRPYKGKILRNCEEMIGSRQRTEALQTMEMWQKIMPEDEDIRAGWYLAKISCVRTQSQIEKLIREILEKTEVPMGTGDKKEQNPGYRKALAKAWKRLGYPGELATLRADLACISEESELEWLAEKVRSRQIHKEEKPYVYKLVGDIRSKQGQTREAFENYRKALEYTVPPYLKTELYRIIISDLDNGSRQIRNFGKNADMLPAMNSWLGKYGSLEEIQALAARLV
ncbi:LicD family protein [Blautia difficilis]|uniref:LicD family protein n=1 Tax=Blautia difficilis TaxID=2763027 RepID=A0ABR7IFS0_9FIRM|nr:LicD family protein [Blautia difficilis]MBC5778871.1 LicD family protein [Blautia difficilis]